MRLAPFLHTRSGMVDGSIAFNGSTSRYEQWDNSTAAWKAILLAGDVVSSGGGSSTVNTSARLTGDGSVGIPLDIAQQGANVGQVLKWSGTAWVPGNVNGNITTSNSSPLAGNAGNVGDVWVNTTTHDVFMLTESGLPSGASTYEPATGATDVTTTVNATKRWQTFTMPASGTISSVGFYATLTGTAGTSEFKLALEDASGTTLASGTFSVAATNATAQYYTVTFATAVAAAAGTQYRVSIIRQYGCVEFCLARLHDRPISRCLFSDHCRCTPDCRLCNRQQ